MAQNPIKPNEYLHDIAVQYQVYLERVKQHEVNLYDQDLIKLDRQLRAVINATGDGNLADFSKKQFDQLVQAANSVAEQHTSSFIARFAVDLKEIAVYSARFEAQTLSTGLVRKAAVRVRAASAAKAWQRAQAQPVQATGQLLDAFIDTWQRTTLSRVEGVLRTGRAQGQTTGQIIRTLRGTKANNYKDGILTGQNRRQTAAVVRTAIQHTATQGRAATWEENDDIVSGYIWVSVLDNRTTQVCRSLDGLAFKIGKGPMPPIHINCRSVTVAQIDGVDVLKFGTRASKGVKPGQVQASTTFYEWLKTQPASFQDDAIGPVRGKLLRNGGLSAEEFAALNLDKNFQPLTLAEMREKAPGAFKRAGL